MRKITVQKKALILKEDFFMRIQLKLLMRRLKLLKKIMMKVKLIKLSRKMS